MDDKDLLSLDIEDMKRDFEVQSDEELAKILIHPTMHPKFKEIEESPHDPKRLFPDDLTYQRFNWSLEIIHGSPYHGTLPKVDFDYLAERLQTGSEYLTVFVFPVLAHLGLLKIEESSVSLTDKAYDIIRRK